MTEAHQIEWFYVLEVHEPGHIIGLRHPHDGMLNVNGEYVEKLYWLWDESATIMSYRVAPKGGDQLDRDHMARGHTLLNIDEANRNLECAYENLKAAGNLWVPQDLLKKVREVERNAGQAARDFSAGKWMTGVACSLDALKVSRQVLNATGSIKIVERTEKWDGVVTHAGGLRGTIFLGTRVEVNPFSDYRRFQINESDERMVIKVDWSNKAQATDLYAGWSVDGDFYGAVFDNKEERRGTLGCSETIDLDPTTSFMRSLDCPYAGMGLYDKVAVDVHYTVTVTVYSRANGGLLAG